MARSLMLAMTVAACSVLLVADFADARHCGRRHRGCGGGCGGGGYTSCGGGCGSYGGCGGGCGGGGCQQAMPYNGQPIPDNGSAPPPPPGGVGGAAPPPPSAAIPTPAPSTVTVNAAQPIYTPQYTNTVSTRRGLFGRR